MVFLTNCECNNKIIKTYAVLIGSSYWMPFANSATPISAAKNYPNIKLELKTKKKITTQKIIIYTWYHMTKI